jgi:hypothetical protein
MLSLSVKRNRHQISTVLSSGRHGLQNAPDDTAAVHIRGISRDTFSRLKMAAAAEKKTVRDLLLKMIDDKIQELEKKGLLPKGK